MNAEKQDIQFMGRCLELAQKGAGYTAPNPLVGCILVAGGEIIAQGYHREFGGPHAEVNAIAAVRNEDWLSRSTLYVNLEPCAHHGKTPPCTDLIIDKGITRVVVGMGDPNTAVNGLGISRLQDHGVDVQVGIREKECLELNRRFVTYHQEKRPYIILKWAETKDGFIDLERKPGTKRQINWITGMRERQLVHKWRSEEGAILVGTKTALTDDPELTVRDWSGRQPMRLVFDRLGKLPGSLKLLDGKTPTVVFTDKDLKPAPNISPVKVPWDAGILDGLLEYLYKIEIQSIIVEGGRATLENFISRNLWDEARIFTGDKRFGSGVRAPHFEAEPSEIHPLSNSTLSIYRRKTLIPPDW